MYMKNPIIFRHPESVSRVNTNGSVSVVLFGQDDPRHYVLEGEDSTLYSLVNGERATSQIMEEFFLIHHENSQVIFFRRLKQLLNSGVVVVDV